MKKLNEEKFTSAIMEGYREDVETKGERWAITAGLASVFAAIVLAADSDDEISKTIDDLKEYFRKFPKEYIEDAFNIAEIYGEDGNISLNEATDRYFKSLKNKENENNGN